MSSIPVPDERTHYSSRRQDDVDALAWPVFSQRALDLLRSAGEVLHPEPGELLWDTGDTYDLYLVLAGGVLLLDRRDDLRDTMSTYLAQRLTHHERVTVHPRSELSAVHGTSRLSALNWRDHVLERDVRLDAAGLFLMIGADPSTTWLHEAGVELDTKGFVITRDGFVTSVPGVFAVGDVRAGSVKRVASAVGEGSVVISAVHSYLAGTKTS